MSRHRVLTCAGAVALWASAVQIDAQPAPEPGKSTWVFFGDDHRLQYSPDAGGNRIMDFSSAGYAGGGVPLPHPPVGATVSPSGGDDSAAIQAAIDAVSALPLDADGFRGAVQLDPGTYTVSLPLTIAASGVVLRGSGSGEGGTVVIMAGPPFRLLRVNGSGSPATLGTPASITDAYVPSGALSFNVDDASGFSVGDSVLIKRPVTEAWIHLMDMDTLVRNGEPQTWIAPGSIINTDRVIAAIDGHRITLDVPLTDSFDAQLLSPPGSSVVRYTFPTRISKVGVEGFSVIAPAIDAIQYGGLSMDDVVDAWARDVVFQDTQNSVSLGGSVKQATLTSVHVKHTIRQSASGAPVDFAFSGTQILLDRSTVTGNGNTWPAATHSRTTGPVVLLNVYADDRGFAPHQRWGTGLLCDRCNFPNARTGDKTGIAYSNRGNFGSGHGWDAGWAVAWNVTSNFFLLQQPPGSQNFCIGCAGTVLTQGRPGRGTPLLPNGIYDSHGTPVTPSSLYLHQLLERLGPQALLNIGYLDYLKSLDATPPVTAAAVSPAANANGWNNADATVTLSSSDGEPGVGVGVQQITYTTSGGQTGGQTGPGTSTSFVVGAEGTTTVTFFGTDYAGNTEPAKTAVVLLDKTAPTLQGSITPAPNANGWNNSDATVTFDAADALSGVAAVSAPVLVQAEAEGQVFTGVASDRADNASSVSVAVSLDKTPPEALNQFDPATLDVLLFGRDALSGAPAGPIVPSVEVVSDDECGDDDADDDRHRTELRTYTVLDRAGNPLVLVEKARKARRSIDVRIVSLQYRGGPLVTPPRNRQKIEWEIRRNGSFRKLEQRFEVGRGRQRREVSARFDAERNQTVIRDSSLPERVVKPGLVVLQMATENGGLVVRY